MPEYTIKSEISLLTQDAHAALQKLRQEYEDLRKRLETPVNIPGFQTASPSGASPSGASPSGASSPSRASSASPSSVTRESKTAAAGVSKLSIAVAAFGEASSIAFQTVRSGLSKTIPYFRAFGNVASKSFGIALSGVRFFVSGIFSGLGVLRTFGGLVGSALTLPIKAASLAFRGLGTAVGAIRTAASTVKSLLAPAAQMQQYGISMEVLLKNAGKAKTRLAELQKYARDTNFDPQQVIEASNMMQAFGIHGNTLERLKLAGDAANAFGKDIREVVTSLNYLGSGRGGEAFESLARIGITRDKLKPYGVKFGSQGQLVSSTKKALQAVFDYFEKNFGGMTARQAKTWGGALQQLAGQVTFTLSEGFKSALQPFTDFVTQRLIPAIDDAGKALAKIDWKTTLKPALDILGAATSLAGRLANPDTRKGAVQDAKALGNSLLEAGKTLLGGFGDVANALLNDLGVVIEAAFKPDVLTNTGLLLLNVFRTIVEGGLGIFRTILGAFSDRFKSDIMVALDKIPGINTGETERRKQITISLEKHLQKDIASGKYGEAVKKKYQGRNLTIGQLRNDPEFVRAYREREDKLIAYGSGSMSGAKSDPWRGFKSAWKATQESAAALSDSFKVDKSRLQYGNALKNFLEKTIPEAVAPVKEQIGNINAKSDKYNTLRSLQENLDKDFLKRLPKEYRELSGAERVKKFQQDRAVGWFANGDERAGKDAAEARKRWIKAEGAFIQYNKKRPIMERQAASLRFDLGIDEMERQKRLVGNTFQKMLPKMYQGLSEEAFTLRLNKDRALGWNKDGSMRGGNKAWDARHRWNAAQKAMKWRGNALPMEGMEAIIKQQEAQRQQQQKQQPKAKNSPEKSNAAAVSGIARNTQTIATGFTNLNKNLIIFSGRIDRMNTLLDQVLAEA